MKRSVMVIGEVSAAEGSSRFREDPKRKGYSFAPFRIEIRCSLISWNCFLAVGVTILIRSGFSL
jgi:hypothetical protein